MDKRTTIAILAAILWSSPRCGLEGAPSPGECVELAFDFYDAASAATDGAS